MFLDFPFVGFLNCIKNQYLLLPCIVFALVGLAIKIIKR